MTHPLNRRSWAWQTVVVGGGSRHLDVPRHLASLALTDTDAGHHPLPLWHPRSWMDTLLASRGETIVLHRGATTPTPAGGSWGMAWHGGARRGGAGRGGALTCIWAKRGLLNTFPAECEGQTHLCYVSPKSDSKYKIPIQCVSVIAVNTPLLTTTTHLFHLLPNHLQEWGTTARWGQEPRKGKHDLPLWPLPRIFTQTMWPQKQK